MKKEKQHRIMTLDIRADAALNEALLAGNVEQLSDNNARNGRASRRENTNPQSLPTVVFTSQVFYFRWIKRVWIAASIYFLFMGWHMIIHLRPRVKYWKTAEELAAFDRSNWRLLAALLFILPFKLAFAPRTLQVLSDGSVRVVATLRSYTFSDVRGAQRNTSWIETVKRLRWDFATDMEHRVLVKRGGNKWEMSCSPADPDGFIAAIDEANRASSLNTMSAV